MNNSEKIRIAEHNARAYLYNNDFDIDMAITTLDNDYSSIVSMFENKSFDPVDENWITVSYFEYVTMRGFLNSWRE